MVQNEKTQKQDVREQIDRISVDSFVKLYSMAPNDAAKEKVCKDHMYRTYVPALEKYIALSLSFNNTCRENNSMVHINSFLSHVSYTITTLNMYYGIDFADNKSSMIDDYDLLVQSGARDAMLLAIGEDELTELSRFNSFIIDDVRENELNPYQYFAVQLSKLNEAIQTIRSVDWNELFEAVMNQEERNGRSV